jgi:hypothetical protein
LADDDIVYPSDWLKKLYEAYQKEPNVIHARVTYRIFVKGLFYYWLRRHFLSFTEEVPPSLLYVPIARMGVLYPPHILPKEAVCSDIAMQFAPYDDEIWCWVMMILGGAKIHPLKGGWKDLQELTLAHPLAGRPVEMCTLFGLALTDTYSTVREILIKEEQTFPNAPFFPLEGPGV